MSLFPAAIKKSDSYNFKGDRSIIDYGFSFSKIRTGMSTSSIVGSSSEEGSVNSIAVKAKPGLPYATKFADACGHVLNDLCAALWFTYLLLFFENVARLDPRVAAGLLLLGQVVDGIATVLVGYAVGKVNLPCLNLRGRYYGQCKTWHALGCVLVVLSFPFVFSPCLGCQYLGGGSLASFIYYSPFIALFQIGWAMTQVSHMSLVQKLTPKELVRTEILALRYAFTVGSNITIFLMAWFAFQGRENCQINNSDELQFRNLGLIATGIGILFVIIFHAGVKERASQEIEERAQNHATNEARKVSVKINGNWPATFLSTKTVGKSREIMSLKNWLSFPEFYVVALIYTATRLSFNLTQVYVPIYLQKSLGLPCSTVATIPLTMYVSGLVVTSVIKPINKYMGRQLSYIFGASLSVTASFLIMNLDWNSSSQAREYGIYGLAILMGGGGSAIYVTSLSITSDLIGPHVLTSAFVYGFMSFGDKLASGLGVMLVNSLIPSVEPPIMPRQNATLWELTIPDLAPRNSTVNIPLANFYKDVMTYACGGCATIGVFAILILTVLIYRRHSWTSGK